MGNFNEHDWNKLDPGLASRWWHNAAQNGHSRGGSWSWLSTAYPAVQRGKPTWSGENGWYCGFAGTCTTPGCWKPSNGKTGGKCNWNCGSMATCCTPGCSKRSWNGNPGQRCSWYCGSDRFPCNDAMQGNDASSTFRTETAGTHVLVAACSTPGCEKPAWKGYAGEKWSWNCGSAGLRFAPGCSEPMWNAPDEKCAWNDGADTGSPTTDGSALTWSWHTAESYAWFSAGSAREGYCNSTWNEHPSRSGSEHESEVTCSTPGRVLGLGPGRTVEEASKPSKSSAVRALSAPASARSAPFGCGALELGASIQANTNLRCMFFFDSQPDYASWLQTLVG